MASYISSIDSSSNGKWPVTMHMSVTPSDQMSAAMPWTPRPEGAWSAPNCSGAAKAGDATPAAGDPSRKLSSPGFSKMAETPKSTSLTVFRSAVVRMLSGLRANA
jgi:hypothetical protein